MLKGLLELSAVPGDSFRAGLQRWSAPCEKTGKAASGMKNQNLELCDRCQGRPVWALCWSQRKCKIYLERDEEATRWLWYSHAFRETNSLRTIQIVECSLLHRRAREMQSLLLAKDPDQHLWKSFIPHVYVSKPTTPIPWCLQRKGEYNHNNPIIHMLCVQTVNNQ